MDCPSEPIELKETMLRIAIIIGSTRPGRNGEAVAKRLNADVGVSEAEKQAASAREHA